MIIKTLEVELYCESGPTSARESETRVCALVGRARGLRDGPQRQTAYDVKYQHLDFKTVHIQSPFVNLPAELAALAHNNKLGFTYYEASSLS